MRRKRCVIHNMRRIFLLSKLTFGIKKLPVGARKATVPTRVNYDELILPLPLFQPHLHPS